MDNDEATQPTQNALDPRRMGRNNSGLSEDDISDVICILHPCSLGAYNIVARTADRSPQNVLQDLGNQEWDDGLTQQDVEEQETFIITGENAGKGTDLDLALRFSARAKNPAMGFIFGRNPAQCDIVLDTDTIKRVSNMHFRIFITEQGVLMLHDISTNGTVVDGYLLRGKTAQGAQTRMLIAGSIIQILSPQKDELVKFIVRIPSREGYTEEYELKFNNYMHRVESAVRQTEQQGQRTAERFTHRRTHVGSVKVPLVQNQFGMHWSGGEQYNVVGQIGKGAFATVFQLATKRDGQLFAAKELEKRKFMKNGILDRKLDNEMQIMREISHPNIVQYIDYRDVANHLYIIMEFVPCGDLQQYLSARGPLTEPLGKLMAEQVFEAMAYLHKNKITHRDIKPDNILLADLDPSCFTIKLSDFGLSKVVKDEDTFLKTFCGTLLYCAPEVFPHYNAHVAGKGNKRPRRSSGNQNGRFHSYSQSVDIWSFGAVLWFSLCCKPPFEGVADNTGRGMFDKIMLTPLDPGDLVKQGVSNQAVALLAEMLNTDPAARPNPAQCLQHSWFGRERQSIAGATDPILGAIAEEDEVDGDGPDVSGLSLDEREIGNNSQNSEVSIHSGSFDFFDPRQSKRVKSMHHPYRDREDMVASSPDLLRQSAPRAQTQPAPQTTVSMRPQAPQQRKLFGEISRSALASATLFGARPRDDGTHVSPPANEVTQSSDAASWDGNEDQRAEQEALIKAALASPSLLGAESLVRDLNMDSPHSGNSQELGSDGAAEPKTPNVSLNRSVGSSNGHPAHLDITPKAAQQTKFSRRIEIPITESFFYDANDPSTHNSEYASHISGYDFRENPSFFMNGSQLPSTAGSSAAVDHGDTDHDDDLNDETRQLQQHQPQHSQSQLQRAPALQPPPPDFLKPPPRLGRLSSTPDSFTQTTLNLTNRLSSWGRQPNNTHIFPDPAETRVPKRGLILVFETPGLPSIPKTPTADTEWYQHPSLQCLLTTESRLGVYVNGVHLPPTDKSGTKRAYGKLFSGDVITVFKPGNTSTTAGSGTKGGKGRDLEFVCEFFHGVAKGVRPQGEEFVVQYSAAGALGGMGQGKKVQGPESGEGTAAGVS
ncbi:hypothetical protein MBLNU230_g5308t1 [Neophaeotheca triangularis]